MAVATTAEYSGDAMTRHSVSGNTTFLNGAVVSARSKQQGCVTLSVTEAEFVSACDCAQDMLYVHRIMTSLGLKVKLPMILEIDNKGTVDLANNWSIGGRTCHIEVRQYFVRELKEANILAVRWKSGDDMSADLFTKNLGTTPFEKHVRSCCGDDEYYNK